ncbi:hypothetical protein LTS14_002453 [Recurvomyces mirabilis]|uniref:uncharacterized protein n=1 Tax=Recurvomyces mirabilis TaxID=574656 RepID=UPI002DDF9487|nr:hypothetical protein LTS14_002453 [Recurvomyces mirabilis]
MGEPTAIFPIINAAHPEAAGGTLLRTFDEFNSLMEASGIEVTSSCASDFDCQTQWLCENCAYDMSGEEITQHAAVFRELGLYLRGSEDRKFKRLPEPASGTVAASAQEREGIGLAVNEHFRTLGERADRLRTVGQGLIAEQLEDGDNNERHLASIQPTVETTTEEDSDEQRAQDRQPMMDELAVRFVPLTHDEADMLEAVWIVYGDQWQTYCQSKHDTKTSATVLTKADSATWSGYADARAKTWTYGDAEQLLKRTDQDTFIILLLNARPFSVVWRLI